MSDISVKGIKMICSIKMFSSLTQFRMYQGAPSRGAPTRYLFTVSNSGLLFCRPRTASHAHRHRQPYGINSSIDLWKWGMIEDLWCCTLVSESRDLQLI